MADDIHNYSLLQRAIDAVHGAWETGCPVAPHAEETAQVAIAHWESAGRPDLTDPGRVEELAKALCARFYEADPSPQVLEEYRFLAQRISGAIRAGSATPG